MGICAKGYGLLKSLKLDQGYSVCELGTQEFAVENWRGLGSELHKSLGCGRYECIDGDGKSTITADLNLPLELKFPGRFDLVTDFGTSEHIFDIAQCWRTIHSLTKPGGVIAFDKPAQEWRNHCFYLTGRTFFLDIASANGYQLIELAEHKHRCGLKWIGAFRRVNDAPFVVPQQGGYAKTLVFEK